MAVLSGLLQCTLPDASTCFFQSAVMCCLFLLPYPFGEQCRPQWIQKAFAMVVIGRTSSPHNVLMSENSAASANRGADEGTVLGCFAELRTFFELRESATDALSTTSSVDSTACSSSRNGCAGLTYT